MEYFFNTVGVVSGIVIPVIIFKMICLVIDFAESDLKKQKEMYRRFMNPDYWIFRKADQAPNEHYIRVYFENSVSKEELKLGIEKKYIKELIK